MKRKLYRTFLYIVAAAALIFAEPSTAEAKEVVIDSDTIPDAYLRGYLADEFDIDQNGILSQEEIDKVQWISFDAKGECMSLEGLQHFGNIMGINCKNGNVGAVDLSDMKELYQIDLNHMGVSSLNLSGCSALSIIDIDDNEVQSLCLDGCVAVESLSCMNNKLTSLNVDDCVMLEMLECSSNELQMLSLKNPRLKSAICSRNALEKLEVSECSLLKELEFESNKLQTIDLSANEYLYSLNCRSNQLTELDLSHNEVLDYLLCDSNKLVSIDVSKNQNLRTFWCEKNRMPALDLSYNRLLGESSAKASYQYFTIEVDDDGKYDFSYFQNFDIEKVSDVVGGVFEGTVFTPLELGTICSYDYDNGVANMYVRFLVESHQHVLEHKEKLLPDCIHDGYEAYYMCSGCGKWYEDKAATKEIADHDSVIIPMTGEHAYDQGSITKKPTCQKEGVLTYTCSGCGEKKTEPIKKVSHEYENVVKRASFSKNGKIETTCKYCKKVKKTIEIAGIKKIKVDKAVYNGKKQKPTVTLSDKNGGEISAYLYSAKYQKNPVKVGSYTVTITLKGIYYGEKKVTYTIQPKSTKIKALKADKKAFTMQWNKVTAQTDGYEFQYSTTKKFTDSTTKTVKVKKNTETKKTVKNLKAKQKYFVRVRTNKKVNGKTYYSDWSEIKSVVTK